MEVKDIAIIVHNEYKQTEVGLIPEDWETVNVAKACKLINGRGFKPFEWRKEGLPIIRIQNLNGSDDYNYYTGHYDKKIEIEKGQLLFAWSGSRGTSFGPHVWYGEKGVLNYHTWKIDINENIAEKSYFLYALKKLTKYIEDQAHGASALVHVQKWEMEKFLFPLPPTKAEQTAIATVLSDTDVLISRLETLIEKKRAIKQGAMQQLLKPKEGWVVKKLGDISEVIGGGTPSTFDSTYWNGLINWFTPTEVGHSKYVSTSIRKITTDGIKNSSAKLLPTGSILLTTRASIGEVSILKNEACTNQGFQSLVPKSNTNGEFLYYLTLTLKEAFLQNASGSTFLEISPKKVKDTEIIVPSTKAEQTRIAQILSDMDAEIAGLEQKLAKYKLVKQGMMQELLTGKTRLV